MVRFSWIWTLSEHWLFFWRRRNYEAICLEEKVEEGPPLVSFLFALPIRESRIFESCDRRCEVEVPCNKLGGAVPFWTITPVHMNLSLGVEKGPFFWRHWHLFGSIFVVTCIHPYQMYMFTLWSSASSGHVDINFTSFVTCTVHSNIGSTFFLCMSSF